MQDTENSTAPIKTRVPWNKGKLIGPRPTGAMSDASTTTRHSCSGTLWRNVTPVTHKFSAVISMARFG